MGFWFDKEAKTCVSSARTIRRWDRIWRKIDTLWYWLVIITCKWGCFSLLFITTVVCKKILLQFVLLLMLFRIFVFYFVLMFYESFSIRVISILFIYDTLWWVFDHFLPSCCLYLFSLMLFYFRRRIYHNWETKWYVVP